MILMPETRRPPKHRLRIHDIGHIREDGTMVEIHSRGGSLLSLKRVIDAFNKRKSLGIKTIYNTRLGAGRLEVIFADDNASEAADMLDELMAKNHEFNVQGYFSDSLAAAILPG